MRNTILISKLMQTKECFVAKTHYIRIIDTISIETRIIFPIEMYGNIFLVPESFCFSLLTCFRTFDNNSNRSEQNTRFGRYGSSLDLVILLYQFILDVYNNNYQIMTQI